MDASDWSALTDARIAMVKGALQLTPDQEKFWPAIEEAIRARAKNRQARIASVAKRLDELRERNPLDVLRDRDPVAFLQRRSEALAQRAADLKRLADAWQPLYQTLSADQKRRMGLLTVFVLRDMREGLQQRRMGMGMDTGMGMGMGRGMRMGMGRDMGTGMGMGTGRGEGMAIWMGIDSDDDDEE